MNRVILAGLLMTMLASCGAIRNTAGALGVGSGSGNAKRTQVEVNDRRFRARATPDRDDARAFTVTVTPVAIDPDAALRTGRYQATRYCLLTFGGSDTEWINGPDTPLSDLPLDGDSVTLSGRCTQR